MKHVLRVIFALFLWSSGLRADDWPQWRGPQRDGVWREAGILESFPKEGLKRRWRTAVGPGWSSPVVAGGRVYVTDAELKKPMANERVLCFEEATGKLLWTHSYPVAYPDFAFDYRRGPAATPIVHEGKIYTFGNKGHLFCLEAGKGHVVWQKAVEDRVADYSFARPSSPLIEGDLLIQFVGATPGGPDSALLAFDKNTGKETWHALNENLTNSSPIVISAGGKRQLLVWTQESLSSLDPLTGKTHWRQRMNTHAANAVATPVVQGDRLLVSGLMLELDVNKPAASILWPDSKAAARRVLSNTSTPLLLGDHIYAGKTSGSLVCLEAKTGNQVWETDKVTNPGSGASIHLTPQGDNVFLYTDKGELILARLSPKAYHEIGRALVVRPTTAFQGRSYAWSPPAYANRHIFARNDEELVCVSLEK